MADTFFAVTAPGLEAVTEQELRALGLLRDSAAQRQESGFSGEESGGVIFTGKFSDMYRANLGLRTASRVLVRLGEFYAAGFPELRKKTARLEWRRFLQPGQPLTLHVTCRKSRLYHSGAVAERVAAAIGDALGQPSPIVRPEDVKAGQPAQLVVVRLRNDAVTISLDTSGELLHRRGYRLETAKAPLRETLAAGMLLASGWDGASPLLDPFCGSGTIAIEAALLAANLPPGRQRRFAFMDWPGFDPKRWEALVAETPPRSPADLPIIQASDRDAGAIRIAQANAARAGVAEMIEFRERAVSAVEPPPGPGWVVTNPPYGARVSASKDLRNLYAQLGNVLRARCPGWQVAILSSDRTLLGQTGIALDTSLALVNGGIAVRLGRGIVIR